MPHLAVIIFSWLCKNHALERLPMCNIRGVRGAKKARACVCVRVCVRAAAVTPGLQ